MSDDVRAGIDKRRAERKHGLTGVPLARGLLTKSTLDDDYKLRTFLENAVEARENGYDFVCAECGAGIFDDGDMHDTSCSHEGDE
jgi:hypothetical protein